MTDYEKEQKIKSLVSSIVNRLEYEIVTTDNEYSKSLFVELIENVVDIQILAIGPDGLIEEEDQHD